MEFFNHAVDILFLLLQFTTFSRNEMPIKKISPHCIQNETMNSDCILKVQCNDIVDFSSLRIIGTVRVDHTRRTCISDIMEHTRKSLQIYLRYKHQSYADDSILRLIPDTIVSNNDPYILFSVTILDISDNEYYVYPYFEQMVNLRYLNLAHNRLNVAKIYGPVYMTLTDINLSFNEIESIETNPEDVQAYNLRTLDLSHNRIKSLPHTFFTKFPSLESLNLSYNYIGSISTYTLRFLGLHSLTTLNISHNIIKKLKASYFYDFVNLVRLDLSNNFIRTIEPCSFCNLKYLASIDLHHNLLWGVNTDTFLDTSSSAVVDISDQAPHILFLSENLTVYVVSGIKLAGNVSSTIFEGLNEATRLILSYQHFTTVQDNAFQGLENLTTILLNNNEIYYLSRNSFRKLNKLSSLDLSYNNITDLNINLDDLTSVRTIILNNNFIFKIRRNTFRGLNSLRLLDLRYNKISIIESSSFSSLGNLVTLEISNNPMNGTLIEKTFDDLNSLPSLVISFTQLTVIENGSFHRMPELNTLNMSHNCIKDLYYNAFNETGALKHIDLSYNRLETFNVNASALANIETLLLNGNLIMYITESIFAGFTHLTYISLANNMIGSLNDEAFRYQVDLRYLDLSHNVKLNFNVSRILKNKYLKYLYLSGIRNKLSFLHVNNNYLADLTISNSGIINVTALSLNGSTRLENLVLFYNEIKKLEVGAFTNASELRRLDVSNNKISYMQPGVFKDTQLKYLNISHNLITRISYGTFRGLVNLKILDLSYNNIMSLEGHRFFDIQGLSMLLVDNNKIRSFNEEELNDIGLSQLSIGGNPLPCKLILKLKNQSHTFLMTAVHLNEYAENIDGITCNDDYDNKKNPNDLTSLEKEPYSIYIKDFLIKIGNKKQDSYSDSQGNSGQINNVSAYTTIEKFDVNMLISSNVSSNNNTSMLSAQTNDTNLFWSKILTAVNKEPVASTTAKPNDNYTYKIEIR